MNINIEFLFVIITNVLAASVSIGGIIITIKFLGEKFDDFKKETKGNFERLERKQDKHNGLIERMAVLEYSEADRKRETNEIFKRLREGGL
jgi:hypothetical protein